MRELMKIKTPFLALLIAFVFCFACSQNESGETEEIIAKESSKFVRVDKIDEFISKAYEYKVFNGVIQVV